MKRLTSEHDPIGGGAEGPSPARTPASPGPIAGATTTLRELVSLIAFVSCLLLPLPGDAGQLSGPDLPGTRPVARPGFIGVRDGPLLPDLIAVFNENFDRETRGVTGRGGAQRAFCDGPGEAGTLPPSVMILALYENGAFRQGSGTVIRGSGTPERPDRVLTASHVLPPSVIRDEGGRSALERIMAFGADGALLAELSPVLAGDVHALNRLNDADLIFDDVAVLEPVRFSGDAAERDWARMGALLSSAQPERLMALFQPSGSVALNPGMSGAGVFDASGRLIGVMSYNLYLSGDPYLERPETGYEDRVLTRNAGDGAAAWSSGLRELTETAGRRLRRDNVGYALPVRHAEVLEALRAPARPDPLSPDGDAVISGYPFLSCLSVDLRRLGSDLPLAASTMRGLVNFETWPGVDNTRAGPQTTEVTHE